MTLWGGAMANPNGAKGAKWERDIVAYLRDVFGRLVRRPHQEGFADVGDIHLSPFCLQAKDFDNVTNALRIGVAGAELQAPRAEEKYGLAVIKRRGKGASEAYVAMSLRQFRELAADYHELAKDAARWRDLLPSDHQRLNDY